MTFSGHEKEVVRSRAAARLVVRVAAEQTIRLGAVAALPLEIQRTLSTQAVFLSALRHRLHGQIRNAGADGVRFVRKGWSRFRIPPGAENLAAGYVLNAFGLPN